MASKLKAKAPVKRERRRAKVLIYGKPGVGKTTFAMDFPCNYYIDSEGGAQENSYVEKLLASGGVYLGPEDGATDFNEVIGQFKALATEKHDYVTVIDDSISKLFNSAISHEQTRLGDKDVYGASKKTPVAKIRELLNWVSRIDMNVVLIAHEKDEYTQVGSERQVTGSTFDCWDRLEYELDLVLRVEKQGNKRVMRVRKSRLTEFVEGTTFPCEFAEFAERFGASDIQGAATVVPLVSQENVAEIKRLVDLIHIPEDEVQKWFTKGNATAIDEFSVEHAEKILTFLQNKFKKGTDLN